MTFIVVPAGALPEATTEPAEHLQERDFPAPGDFWQGRSGGQPKHHRGPEPQPSADKSAAATIAAWMDRSARNSRSSKG